MRGHPILLRPLLIWLQYTHHVVYAFTWQPKSKKKMKRAQNFKNVPASVPVAQKPHIMCMSGKEGGLRWNPFSLGKYCLCDGFIFNV